MYAVFMSNGNFGWPDSSKMIQCQLDPKHTCLPDRIKIYLELNLTALAQVVEYCGVKYINRFCFICSDFK